MSCKVYDIICIERHNKESDLWVIIHNKVYDLTKYAHKHPGGVAPLLQFAGKNATKAYEKVGHSPKAQKMMLNYYVGELNQEPDMKKFVAGAEMCGVMGVLLAFLIKRPLHRVLKF